MLIHNLYELSMSKAGRKILLFTVCFLLFIKTRFILEKNVRCRQRTMMQNRAKGDRYILTEIHTSEFRRDGDEKKLSPFT
jgi:hypothetical protein